jgi:hypothetical protein
LAPAEDGGDEVGSAGQPPGVGGADRLLANEAGSGQLGLQGLQVDGDQHRGRIAAVQRHPVGVDGLQERSERLPQPSPRLHAHRHLLRSTSERRSHKVDGSVPV